VRVTKLFATGKEPEPQIGTPVDASPLSTAEYPLGTLENDPLGTLEIEQLELGTLEIEPLGALENEPLGALENDSPPFPTVVA